jgi:glycosyltransferase involved in cell wall biosynthesis
LVSVSQFTADLTNQVFGLNKQFTIIPNAIDVNLFKNTSNMDNNLGKTILYFGSLIRKKGLLELPHIFNEVIQNNPEAQLILIGNDVPDIISGNKSTWQMMQELFSDQALQNVRYLGSVPYKEIKKQIDLATVCVFPSFAEALPVSWIEAMALQKAVVASNIGWATEIISDGQDGFLINPRDHVTYAQKILKLLDDTNLREEFGIKARNRIVQKFSIEIVAQQSFNFYKRVLNQQK